jgi:carboxylesterase
MTEYPHLNPSPFLLAGGPVGVLLIHGFTGAPPEMRLLGDSLHAQGMTVSGPLLPGHGTSVDDLNSCRWTDWLEHADNALADLRARCETVFVAGLSMGSLLTLQLAALHLDVAGVVVYSPALKIGEWRLYLSPVFKYLFPKWPKSSGSDSFLTDPQAHLRVWSYEEYPVFAAHELLKLTGKTRHLLAQVTCPSLVIHSALDHATPPASAHYTFDRIGSVHKEIVTLQNSGHALTVDSEWAYVAGKSYQFFQQYSPR